MEFIKHLLDPIFLIQSAGLLGVFAIVFAESGLFFGFFFPGDSLLFTAGLLSAQGYFNPLILLAGVFVCAVLGDTVGYSFGFRWGRRLFEREDSLFFRKEHLYRTERFFEKYGTKAIILARFVPIVRTFTPILAGVGQMKYRTFITYNILGGLGWSVLMIVLGFYLGTIVPNIDKYILPIVLVIIFVSFLPIAYEFLKNRNKKV